MEGLGLRRLSRTFGATFGRQLSGALLGLATFALIARAYGAEGNGAYAVALLIPSTLATLLNLGVAPANVYHLGSGRASVRAVLRVNVRIALVLTLIGLGIGVATLAWKGTTLFPGVDPLLLWFALTTFPVGLLNVYLLSIFQGLQRFTPYNLLSIVQPLTLLVGVAGLILFGSRDLALLVAATLLSHLVVLAFTLASLRPVVAGEPPATSTPTRALLQRTLGYGGKAHLSNILTFVNYRADVFIVNLFLGPSAVGLYVVAVAFAERLWLISQSVSTVLLPLLSQLDSDEEKRKSLTPIVSRWVLAVTGLGAAVLAALAVPLVVVLFGSEFRGAVAPLLWLLPGVVLISASRVLANDIAARGRPELNLYTAIPVVLVNVSGNVLLIPQLGLVGAALATTIAYSLDLVLRLLIYGRFSENPWSTSLFLRLRDMRMLSSEVARLRRR